MDQFFDNNELDWLHPDEINDDKDPYLTEEHSPFPLIKMKERKRDICNYCIEEGLHESNACKKCMCPKCFPRDTEKEKFSEKEKPKKHQGCPNCYNPSNNLHPCHRNFSSNCFFAYYKAYSVDKNKKAEIHFVQPNLLSAYFNISECYRGNFNELWPTMVTVSFYHELGHHLVQLYVDALTHSNYSRHLKRQYIPENDEQKLCEYIGFKKTHELLEQTKTIPEKYKRKTTRGSKKNNMNKRDYDIGNSGIYHKLPLYTTQPFSASFQQPRSRTSQVEYVRPINDYSGSSSSVNPDELLSVIAKTKGGRGREEHYYPEITNTTQEFINIDKKLWNNLFNTIIKSGKTSKRNIKKNIITKNNIITCSDPNKCKIPLDNKRIENQSKISLEQMLRPSKDIRRTYKFIGFSHSKKESWKKGRTLNILQKYGYTHQEYRKIRKDSNLKNIPKPKKKMTPEQAKKAGKESKESYEKYIGVKLF